MHIGRPGDKTVLQAGIWLDDFGAAVSEPFIVTEAGGERISQVDRELIVID